jgi:cytochrome b561
MTAEPARYTTPAIVLHWLLALLITVSFCVGLYMTGLETSPTKLKIYNWHKWAGIVILTLSAARLLWRLSHRPPAEPAMPAWQRSASHVTHWALYALFFAVPLAGWAYSSAAGFPVVVFGVLPLPDFVAPDKALAAALRLLHRSLAYTLAALVLLHVAGALKHHWIDHDGLLARMRWRRA